MSIFVSFIPWIAMFICVALGKSMLFYAGVALGAQLLVILKESFRAKLLDCCSLCFFILLLLISQSNYYIWVNQYLSYLSHAYLALIVFCSILFRSPFTLAYAKEITSESQWEMPLFYKINLFLSFLWGCFFILELLIQLLFNKSIFMCNLLKLGALVVVIILTKKIPIWMTKKVS